MYINKNLIFVSINRSISDSSPKANNIPRWLYFSIVPHPLSGKPKIQHKDSPARVSISTDGKVRLETNILFVK